MTWEPEPPTTVEEKTVQIAGLKASTAYNVRVRSVTGTGKQRRVSTWAFLKTATEMGIPLITDIVSDTIMCGSDFDMPTPAMRVFFEPILGATAYDVQWSQDNGTTWLPTTAQRLNNVSGSIVTNCSTPTPNFAVINRVRVRSVHVASSSVSAWNETVSTPTGMSVAAKTDSSIDVSWTDETGTQWEVQNQETV